MLFILAGLDIVEFCCCCCCFVIVSFLHVVSFLHFLEPKMRFYQFKRDLCDTVYVGYSGWHLHQRIRER